MRIPRYSKVRCFSKCRKCLYAIIPRRELPRKTALLTTETHCFRKGTASRGRSRAVFAAEQSRLRLLRGLQLGKIVAASASTSAGYYGIVIKTQ